MCACVRTTASMPRGCTGSADQSRRRSAFQPWKRPQSTSTRPPDVSTRYFDPVTVSVAPRIVSLMSLHEEDRDVRGDDHLLRDAAHERAADEAVAVGAHHDHVGVALFRRGDDLVARVADDPAATEGDLVAREEALDRLEHLLRFVARHK